MIRLLSILLVGLALTSFASVAVDEVHEGKVLQAKDGKISLQDKDGNSEVFEVAPDAKIMLDGKAVKLEEIAIGNIAKVTVKTVGDKKTATVIDAKSKV
jgi:hypothetical protein